MSNVVKDHEASHDGAKSLIRVKELNKRFLRSGGAVVNAVADIDLEVHEGEIVCLLGPSGCGKTTLLRCIAGLEVPSSGSIEVNGVEVFSPTTKRLVPPEKRDLSMMFQSYALWPHMSVGKNVGYPLRSRKWARASIPSKVREVLSMVGIPELEGQMPGTLSGGQQQRVALARCLVSDPSVVLFDEPLSNVDAKVREILRVEILEMHRRVGFAALYVTHDQDEAMRLADRVAVMDNGRIIDIGPPERIYREPNSLYVAKFVGSLNVLPARFLGMAGDHCAVVEIYGRKVVIAASLELLANMPQLEDVILVGARPENIQLEEKTLGEAELLRTRAEITQTMFLGAEMELLLNVDGQQIMARVAVEGRPAAGEEVEIFLRTDSLRAFPVVA